MKKIAFISVLFAIIIAACTQEPPQTPTGVDLRGIAYSPQPFSLTVPVGFPQPDLPAGYQFDGNIVELGRHLFYDKRLSRNNTLSCASCHLQTHGFSDTSRFSVGVEGGLTPRQSMAIQNLAFRQTEMFWDGRAASLEEQAIQPVENPIELHENWKNVEQKVQNDTMYQRLFRKAYGISYASEITKELAVKAIAMFERTIIVGSNSLYWKMYVTGAVVTDDDIDSGRKLFFNLEAGDAQCFHCHDKPLFKSNFHNNGLDAVSALANFADKGRGAITHDTLDNGKFRAPSLWNIGLTAPYMHDGRFATLDEVIDHYADHIHYAANINPFLTQVGNPVPNPNVCPSCPPTIYEPLDAQQKAQLKAFLLSLTDTISLKKAAYQNPFH
ncbi:MAG: hypothetical protein RI894_1380 [Bacteroidota bacterium]|jgi:cytochrome c peroxidase